MAQTIERSWLAGFDRTVHRAEADCIDVNDLARIGGDFVCRSAPVLPEGRILH
jgi:hypothetical protein